MLSVALENVNKLTQRYEGVNWPSIDCNSRTDVAKFIHIIKGLTE